MTKLDPSGAYAASVAMRGADPTRRSTFTLSVRSFAGAA